MQRFIYTLLLLAATLIYTSCVSDSTSSTVTEKMPPAKTIKKPTPQPETPPPPPPVVEEKKVVPPASVPKPKSEPAPQPVPVKSAPIPQPVPVSAPQPVPISKPIPPPLPPSRGTIVFENRTLDYGYIEEDSVINHVFTFRNTGSVPVNILNAEVSCGCTFPSYSFLPIEPGATGEIKARFDSEGKLGKTKSTITLLTDARPAKQELFLIGTVIPPRKKEKKEEEKDEPKATEKTDEKATETADNKQDIPKTDSVKFTPRGPRKLKLPEVNSPQEEEGKGN